MSVLRPYSIFHTQVNRVSCQSNRVSRNSLSFITSFSYNYSDSCASAPFLLIPSASEYQSWYVRDIMDIALEVVKEKIPDRSAVVYSNPFTTILHNLNLTLPTGSCCLLIGENGSGKSTLLRILGGRNLPPPKTQMCMS